MKPAKNFPLRRALNRLLLALAAITCLFSLKAYADEPVRIGIFSFRPKGQTLKQWQPLATLLKQAMPEREFIVEPMSYEEIDNAVASRMLDFVLINPGHYIFLNRRSGLSAPLATLAVDGDGTPLSVFAGVIIARADAASINALTDVSGRRVAIINIESLGGYQMQAGELKSAGLAIPDPEHLLITNTTHDDVIEAVLSGRAEVGFVRSGVIEAMTKEGKLDPAKLKIINAQSFPNLPFKASTKLYPEWPIAALPYTSEALARLVTASLLTLADKPSVARAIGIHGFVVPGDYSAVEDLLRDLRMPPFERVAEITLTDLWQQYRWSIVVLLFALTAITVLTARLIYTRTALASESRRLQQSEQHFRQLANGGAALIWTSGTDTLCNYFNETWLSFTGRTLQQELGNGWAEGVHPDDLERCVGIYTSNFDQRQSFSMEYRLRHASGDYRWILDLGTPRVDIDGNFIGFLGFCYDITERRNSEAELAQHRHHLEEMVFTRTTELATARDQAEAASRAKSTFLANMSHELRTPMTAIMGMVDLVLRKSTEPKQKDQLTKAKLASQHLLSVINNILDISKIEAERLTLERLHFRFSEVLETLVGVIGQKISDKGLRLHVDLPPEIAATAYRGDPLRLGQILLNFVGNAVKFTESGVITVRARLLEDNPRESLLRWEVTDTGIGITAADQQRLFTSFEQADGSMTRKYGGTGLGLAISKRLAELMGGEVGVDSQFGQGSTFWFTVRLSKDHHAVPPAPTFASSSAEAQIKSNFAGTRILLAEDEPVSQEVSRGLLEDVGLHVDVADDGAIALALARRHRYGVILMDMQMPNLNGVDATREIRRESLNTDTPILAMTANAFDDDRQTCIDAGMNDHIAKPVEPHRLFDVLLKWLSAAKN